MQGGYLGGVFCAVHAGMSAGVAALIVGMQPLLTAAGAGPMLGERILRIQGVGLALGLIGVALVVWQKMSLQGLSSGSFALAMLALLSITFGTLYQKRYCPSFDLRSGSVIQFTAALIITLPLAFALDNGRSVTPPLGWRSCSCGAPRPCYSCLQTDLLQADLSPALLPVPQQPCPTPLHLPPLSHLWTLTISREAQG
jgi:drug/metabolite transporter (DMT)-like permease